MIIGIGHTIKCGKDLASKFLIEHFNDKYQMEFVNEGFSYPMKKRVAFTWGIDWKNLHDQDFKMSKHPYIDLTWREILQKEGAMLRDIDKGYHIKALDSSLDSDGNYLILDLRFDNEFDFIKSRGGYTIRVNRMLRNKFPKLWKDFGLSRPVNEDDIHFRQWMVAHPDPELNRLGSILNNISETSLNERDDWDLDIDNNGTKEEFREALIQGVESIIRRDSYNII